MVKDKLLMAIVGMPGAGKSEAVSYVQKKGIPFIRFGSLTEEELTKKGLPIIPENERMMREKLRKDFGMDVYAVKAEPKITELLKDHSIVVVDGLYSWEEYIRLKQKFPSLVLIHVYSEPEIRYQRLAARLVRPLSKEESRQRDVAEIEQLHKGGPIAIADNLIINDTNIDSLHQKIDKLLKRYITVQQ